jgi:SAM-dependent methyltransferase
VKKSLEPLVPNPLKPTLRNIDHFLAGIIDRFKSGDSMTPPESMIFIGHGDFEQIGEEFKQHFTELANLQPDERVLDVGCGIGRMAVPLTGYLSEKGGYWGFDIVKDGIEWCQRHITPKFGNFHFQHSNIYNKLYNQNGKVQARDYRFPFENGFFDFVFLTSVFTHMLPSDVENYTSEISRVLRTGGRCLITFFILNEESRNLIRSGSSTLDFKYQIEGCLTTSESVSEDAIAYDEELVKKLFENHGLVIRRPIHYGSWCKRENFLTYQDLIIAEKRA